MGSRASAGGWRDEGLGLGLKVAGQEVDFQEGAVLEGLVPALDLALGLDIVRQFAFNVAGTNALRSPNSRQRSPTRLPLGPPARSDSQDRQPETAFEVGS